MKKLLNVMVALFVLTNGMVLAQQKAAHISFEKAIHDFGKIKENGGNVSYNFNFTNTGSVPLIIKQVRASCGCTSPSWSKEPVLPGKRGFIKATFNPKNRPHNFNKSITITTNADNPVEILRIMGNVLPRERTIEDDYPRAMGDLRFKSNSLPLSKINFGEKKTDTLYMVNAGNLTIKVELDKLPKHISYKAMPQILKPKQKGKIAVTYDSKVRNDWDYLVDNITVNVNGEMAPNGRITISSYVVENFDKMSKKQKENPPVITFADKTVDFGNAKKNEKKEVVFKFENTGKTDLIIRKIKASCGCTAIQPPKTVIKAGEKSEIKAIFTGYTPGRQSKSVTVVTNDPVNSRIILRLMGNVVKE